MRPHLKLCITYNVISAICEYIVSFSSEKEFHLFFEVCPEESFQEHCLESFKNVIIVAQIYNWTEICFEVTTG